LLFHYFFDLVTTASDYGPGVFSSVFSIARVLACLTSDTPNTQSCTPPTPFPSDFASYFSPTPHTALSFFLLETRNRATRQLDPSSVGV
jgi:hypothetical protein